MHYIIKDQGLWIKRLCATAIEGDCIHAQDEYAATAPIAADRDILIIRVKPTWIIADIIASVQWIIQEL